MKRYMLTLGLVTVGAVALVAFVSATDANAHGRMHGQNGQMGQGCAGCGSGTVANLNLSTEQQKKISELRTKMMETMSQVRTQMVTKRLELQKLWSAKRPDRSAILAKQAEMNSLQQKMRQAKVDHRLAVLNLLTDEQRANFTSSHSGCQGNCMGMDMDGMGCGGMHGKGMRGKGMRGKGMRGMRMGHGGGNGHMGGMGSGWGSW